MKKKLITKLGEIFIKNKIQELENKKPEILKELKKSRELGDLSENSEYQISKNLLISIEKEIEKKKSFLSECKIIKPEDIKNKNIINFSANVLLKNLDNNEIKEFQIVNNEEINRGKNLISIDSPLAKLMIGKSLNDIITIKKINKKIQYEIISIIYI